MEAFKLPKVSEDEKRVRKAAIQAATRYAIEVPFKVMQLSFQTMEIIKAMVVSGNPNSITDAGVGALCARTAVSGAYMNVKVNSGSYDDKSFVKEILAKGAELERQALQAEAEICKLVNEKIG